MCQVVREQHVSVLRARRNKSVKATLAALMRHRPWVVRIIRLCVHRRVKEIAESSCNRCRLPLARERRCRRCATRRQLRARPGKRRRALLPPRPQARALIRRSSSSRWRPYVRMYMPQVRHGRRRRVLRRAPPLQWQPADSVQSSHASSITFAASIASASVHQKTAFKSFSSLSK